jgi:hypothetical protein
MNVFQWSIDIYQTPAIWTTNQMCLMTCFDDERPIKCVWWRALTIKFEFETHKTLHVLLFRCFYSLLCLLLTDYLGIIIPIWNIVYHNSYEYSVFKSVFIQIFPSNSRQTLPVQTCKVLWNCMQDGQSSWKIKKKLKYLPSNWLLLVKTHCCCMTMNNYSDYKCKMLLLFHWKVTKVYNFSTKWFTIRIRQVPLYISLWSLGV